VLSYSAPWALRSHSLQAAPLLAQSGLDRGSPWGLRGAARRGGSRSHLTGEQDEVEYDVGGQLRRVVPAAEARLHGVALEAQRARGRR